MDFINSINYTITPEITIVTNGSLINDEFATRIMAYRNLKVNISIHSFNNTIYQELTNPTKVKLEQVLENVRLLVDKKIKTKINYVVVKNKNNHDEQILEAVKVITIGVIVE